MQPIKFLAIRNTSSSDTISRNNNLEETMNKLHNVDWDMIESETIMCSLDYRMCPATFRLSC